MTVLSKGANAPLATGRADIAVAGVGAGSVDLMVFQLGADAKVRSDADFVFFNQPSSPEGAVRLVTVDRVTADLAAVPASIQTLAVAVALDIAVPGSLAAIPGLGVTVSAGESHRADASGLTTERAAILVEIYRRAGGWKVRNVSAGWAAGLPALAAAHGVTVDDAPADPAVALPPAVLPDAWTPGASVNAPASTPFGPPASAPGGDYFAPAAAHSYPMPGGFPPPGGNLPPRPEIVPPRPGGWLPPGGSLRAR
jgi:stress response protein SCP2